jgi:hypothetical protein
MRFKPFMDLVNKLAVLWFGSILTQVRRKASRVLFVVAYIASLMPNYNSARRRILENYWIMLQTNDADLDQICITRRVQILSAIHKSLLRKKCKYFTQSSCTVLNPSVDLTFKNLAFYI